MTKKGGKRIGAGRPYGAKTKSKPLTDKTKCFYRMVTPDEFILLDEYLKQLRT